MAMWLYEMTDASWLKKHLLHHMFASMEETKRLRPKMHFPTTLSLITVSAYQQRGELPFKVIIAKKIIHMLFYELQFSKIFPTVSIVHV